MEIKTENGNIDVVPGKYAYDETSDTWIAWELLDEPTKAHLEVLVNEASITATAISSAIKNSVQIIDMVPQGSKNYVA